MRYSVVMAIAALLTQASAHGVLTEVQGANGVVMPGLSVIDGTPRDCASPGCGAEADTSVIRANELGTSKASALGRTSGGGPVDAAAAISAFMGATAATAASSNTTKRGLLSDFLGSKSGGGSGGAGSSGATSTGTKSAAGAVENGVAAAAGSGAASGLPTCNADGTLNMTLHQVNQDGAGPFTAAVDPTSGGTDPAAFTDAAVTMNVPGAGIGGLSLATTTDFPVQIQMPAGMVCSGSVGGASNVCIVKMQNSALAGPFGGSVAFTQSPAAKKRAVEFRLKQRGLHIARGLVGKARLE